MLVDIMVHGGVFINSAHGWYTLRNHGSVALQHNHSKIDEQVQSRYELA